MAIETDFIEYIAPIVIEVFCDTEGVNPSVIIAQAILESGFGTSELSKYNNLFGLNDYSDGYLVNNGNIEISVPQERNGQIVYGIEKMATFKNVKDCVLSIKKWYTRPKYVKALKGCYTSTSQIKAIHSCGYATDSKYVDKIISIINRFNLTKYDTRYGIQIGAYAFYNNAKKQHEVYTDKGYVSEIFYTSPWYKVAIGISHCLKNVDSLLNDIKHQLPKGSFVTKLKVR